MSTCRSCGAAIWWTLTEHGKRMPVDSPPVNLDELESVAGLFAVRRIGDSLHAFAATPEQMPGAALYRSHFATCPDAGAWRR